MTFNPGEKVIWKGDEHIVLKIYEQTMVQIVDSKNNVRSAPLISVVHETMNTACSAREEHPNG